MKDILFKAKRMDDGEWVQGLLCKGLFSKFAIEEIKEERRRDVDPETVCQFTGLTDNNGKKIFDGDILNVDDGILGKTKFVVRFGNCGGVKNTNRLVGYYGFFFEGYDEETKNHIKVGLRDDPMYWLSESFCEVIGNIYDKEV